MKAIINSSINPLTTIFHCKNGYILRNPILEEIVKRICEESTSVANSQGINLSSQRMIDRTVAVIQKTAENYSSMLQSLNQGKQTEIDSINGKIIEMGVAKHIDTPLNEILVSIVKSLVKT
jgi:2-dehydropantoate 2-reductase